MSIIAALNEILADAFAACGYDAQAARAVRSQRPELADYQCNGAMAAGKTAGKPLRAVAEDIAARLKTRPDTFAEVSVAGPGFINMRLAEARLAAAAGALLNDPYQGYDPSGRPPRRIVLDFSGPNVAKEMLAFHVRSTILGDSLQRILRFAGDHVTSDAHFGDWGMPMGMVIAELRLEQPDLPYFDAARTDGYPEMPPVDIETLSALYRRASARGKESEAARKEAREVTAALQARQPGFIALWQHFRGVTFEAVRRNLARLDIWFDLWLGESDVADRVGPMIAALKARGLAVESEGALVIPMGAANAGPPMPPLILEKSDGGYTYAATDLATIAMRRAEQGPDAILYVVDARQAQHFQQVFRGATVAGEADGIEFRHVAFGTINGKDGKPFKTRAGGVMRLEDVLDLAHARALEELPDTGMDDAALDRLAEQISVAAIKFQDLKNNRLSDYVFDPDSFTKFEGKTGPYLQYAIVRCNAILAKAGAAPVPGPVALGNPPERALALALLAFPDVVEATIRGLEPSILAEHAYGVAQAFSTFYAGSTVLAEPDAHLRAGRLRLVAITRQQLKLCLSLLGIEAPEAMPSRRAG